MLKIVEGEYYYLQNGVILVSGIEYEPSEGRRYVHGAILDLEQWLVRATDSEGILIGNVRIWNSGPLSAESKDFVVDKFAQQRKKGIAKKFFKMR